MTIEERVRALHPFFNVRENGTDTVISPQANNTRYEAMIAERVTWATETEAAEVQEQQDAALRAGIINALQDLDQIQEVAQGGANLTQAQIKSGFNTLARIQEDLIRVLIRRGVLS
jgi:hypothetical protein